MGIQAIRHNEKIFTNGMLWSNIIFKAEGGSLTTEQVEELYASLKKRFAGTDNSWKPVITADMEPKNLGFSNRDLEFLASLEWSMADVQRVYGIPGPLLSLKDVTFANADAAERIFWRQTMVSHIRFLEEEINEMLVPMFGEDLICEFDLSQIEALQEDRDKKEAREREDIKLGIQTINEVRQVRSLEPVPWGDEPPLTPGAILGPFGGGSIPSREDMEPKGYRLYRRNWSDEALRSAETLHIRALSRGEKEFLVLQRHLFGMQEDEIIARLHAMSRKALTERQLSSGWLDLPRWLKAFIDRASPLYLDNVERSANAAIGMYRFSINFDPAREAVRQWLRGRVEFWASRVNEETGRLLEDELSQGIAAGESVKQLQERVEKVFRFSNIVRSELIARTETQASVNYGAYASYVQSGVVDSKMWLATQDDRTREHHLEAHRQIVPLEARFEVGGELLLHPGDGSPKNACNCRCTLVPVILPAAGRTTKQLTQAGETNDKTDSTIHN